MGEALGGLKRTMMCGEPRENNVGEKITLMGWVQRNRKLGGLQFIDLRDRAGVMQIVFGEEINAEISDSESHKGSEFLHRLATLSPSADIEQALHFIVGQISGELPPQILFESECRLADGETAVNQGGYSKFIKRWSHILKRVGQLFELIKNIEQIFENGKGLIKE